MLSDTRGDMGFMEAMISAIAVVIVIGMYLAFLLTTVTASYDPLDGFDPLSLEADAENGVSISESYLLMYMVSKGLSGIGVELSIPGYDVGDSSYTIGQTEGPMCSHRYLLLVDYDLGRHIPVIAEVRAYI